MNVVAPTVYLVDDALEVRTALSRLLSAAGYLVRAFESAWHFLYEQDDEAPGCLLLDVCLPGLSGIELQHALVGSRRTRPVVFLTGMGDIQTSVAAMKMGAVDFLTKPIEHERLIAAVEEAIKRDAQQRLERTIRDTIQRRLETLTRREREVMMCVIRGRLNKQIAAELGSGEKTVKVHRSRVMTKMGVRSVPELVQLGARIGVGIEPILTTRNTPAVEAALMSNRESAQMSPQEHKYLLCGKWIVIAVVDDEESVRKALLRVLRAAGFAARGFVSAKEFLASWQFDRPDCLVLDLQMPDISCQEVQQALKVAGARFPIVIVTAHDASSVRDECMRLGAVAYLCKPLDMAQLLQAVKPDAA